MLICTEESDYFLCFQFLDTNHKGLFFVMFINGFNFCFAETLLQILENDKERRDN